MVSTYARELAHHLPLLPTAKKNILSFSPLVTNQPTKVVFSGDQTPPPKCVPFPSDNSGMLFMSSGGVILDLALQHQPIRTMSNGGIPPDLISVVLKLSFCGKKQQKFNVNHLTLAFQGIPGYPKIQTNPALLSEYWVVCSVACDESFKHRCCFRLERYEGTVWTATNHGGLLLQSLQPLFSAKFLNGQQLLPQNQHPKPPLRHQQYDFTTTLTNHHSCFSITLLRYPPFSDLVT